MEKRKFLTLPGLELRPSVVQPLASRYTDYAIPAPSPLIRNGLKQVDALFPLFFPSGIWKDIFNFSLEYSAIKA
jgi:hypothetical protein